MTLARLARRRGLTRRVGGGLLSRALYWRSAGAPRGSRAEPPPQTRPMPRRVQRRSGPSTALGMVAVEAADVAAELFPRYGERRGEQVYVCGAALIGSRGWKLLPRGAREGWLDRRSTPNPLTAEQRRSLFPSLTFQTNRRVLPTATLQRQELRQDQTPLSAIIWRYTTVASSSSTTGVISISQ